MPVALHAPEIDTHSNWIMRFWSWIVLLAGFTALSSALPSRIHVGGIFDADDEEQEVAFRIAVDWLNTDDTLLKNSRVVAMVERLYSENSFKATQLSCGLLEKNITAIFGPQSELTSMHVQSICDDLEVPHIESRWEYRLLRDILSVNLYPHPLVLNKAFVRMLEIWGWNEFFLVYEEDEAIVRMKDFLTEGETRNWVIKLYQFKNHSSYRDTFWEIKRSTRVRGKTVLTDYQIVLDVPRKHLFDVLKAAQQVGMMTEHQKFLITSLDLHTIDLTDFQYSKTNITGLRIVQENDTEFEALLKEVNMRMTRRRDQPALTTLKTETALIYDSVKLLAMALERMDTAKHISVFPAIDCELMNKGVDGTSLINFMKNVEMPRSGLSGKIEFDVEGFRSVVSLDVMYVTPDGLTKIGTILPGNQVNITAPDTSDFKYFGLENSHFKVTTFLNDPYAMLRVSTQLQVGNNRFEGYVIDLMDALAEKMHFTYEIHEVKDKKYGAVNANGIWNGMVGEVIYKEADLAVADLTINSDRLKGVDFTLPFMQTGISILFKKPTQKVTSLFSFLSPFSGGVWLLVMMAYTFVTLSLFVIGRMSPYEWSNPHPCRQNDQVEENCFSLLNSMWFTIGSLMQQGSDVAPTAMSTRAVTSIWYFFCLIMISSYTANLAAFLTVEKLVSPIENVEDLVKQEKIKYGCVKDGSTSNFFKSSNFTTFKKMYSFMQKHKDEVYVESNRVGIAKVIKGDYAFMMEATTIEYNTERECNLTRVGDLLDSKGYGIAVRKDRQQLRNWLSGGILQLQEEGKLHTLKERWWKEKKGGGRCSTSSAKSNIVTELGLGNVGGVFVVMLLGMCLSAFVAVIEFIWFQRKLQEDTEMSMFKLLMKEIQYAISCGSSTKPAPKMKENEKDAEEEEEDEDRPPGFNTLY